MSPLLKICGLTNLEDARFAAGAGADLLGFILHPESPRYVDPNMAKDIVEWIHGPRTVGVFVDKSVELINEVVDIAGFDMVQLHGSETAWECSQINVPVIKAIGVSKDAKVDELKTEIEAYLPFVEYILLDTKIGNSTGGTGVTFDWDLASHLAEDYPILLAGGLNPENVVEAISQVNPTGLDISSGLEESPGKKDLKLIEDLFSNFSRIEG